MINSLRNSGFPQRRLEAAGAKGQKNGTGKAAGSLFVVQISNMTEGKDFTFSASVDGKKRIKIKMDYKRSIPRGTIAEVDIKPEAKKRLQAQSNETMEMDKFPLVLEKSIFYPEGDSAKIELLARVQTAVGVAMLLAFIPQMMRLRFGGFLHLLEDAQICFYFLYLNIEYPRNIASSISAFGILTLKPLMPKVATYIAENRFNVTLNPTEVIWQKHDLRSGMFIINVEEPVFILLALGLVGVGVAAWKTSCFQPKTKKEKKMQKWVKKYVKDSLLKFWLTFFLTFSVMTKIQMKIFEYDDSDKWHKYNSNTAFAFLVFEIFTIILLFYIMVYHAKHKKKSHKHKCDCVSMSLKEELKDHRIKRHYFMFDVLFKVLYAVVAITYYKTPDQQIIGMMVLQFLRIFVLASEPFRHGNVKRLATGGLIYALSTTFVVFYFDEHFSEATILNVGYLASFLCLALVSVHGGCLLKGYFWAQKSILGKKGGKVVPLGIISEKNFGKAAKTGQEPKSGDDEAVKIQDPSKTQPLDSQAPKSTGSKILETGMGLLIGKKPQKSKKRPEKKKSSEKKSKIVKRPAKKLKVRGKKKSKKGRVMKEDSSSMDDSYHSEDSEAEVYKNRMRGKGGIKKKNPEKRQANAQENGSGKKKGGKKSRQNKE